MDGMYFDSSQFFGSAQRAQGGGRALAPLPEEEVRGLDGTPTEQAEGRRKAHASAGVDDLVGVGLGGRGVRVGGGMKASRGKT
jgi:hypothetical protein